MKFMVQMNVKKGPYQMEGWQPEDVKRMVGFMDQLNADLKARGQMVTAEGLVARAHQQRVRCVELDHGVGARHELDHAVEPETTALRLERRRERVVTVADDADVHVDGLAIEARERLQQHVVALGRDDPAEQQQPQRVARRRR